MGMQQRSRPTPVQRKRSHGITQVSKYHHNAYLIEMPQSLSTHACAAKTVPDPLFTNDDDAMGSKVRST